MGNVLASCTPSTAAIGFALAGTFLYVVPHLSNAKSCAYVQKDVVKHGSE